MNKWHPCEGFPWFLYSQKQLLFIKVVLPSHGRCDPSDTFCEYSNTHWFKHCNHKQWKLSKMIFVQLKCTWILCTQLKYSKNGKIYYVEKWVQCKNVTKSIMCVKSSNVLRQATQLPGLKCYKHAPRCNPLSWGLHMIASVQFHKPLRITDIILGSTTYIIWHLLGPDGIRPVCT